MDLHEELVLCLCVCDRERKRLVKRGGVESQMNLTVNQRGEMVTGFMSS